MKNILKLLRIKHYIKNLLVFIPLFLRENFYIMSCLGKRL